MSKNLKGSILLLIAALIWGSSFIVMKSAVDFLTPAVLLLVRFTLASFFLCILFFKKIKEMTKIDMLGGMLTGFCLFMAYYVQTWGLNFTTPGKNAFLTAVYCAIVPFFVWLFYKKRPDIYNFIAAFLCIIGIGFVSLSGDLTINIGDALTLGGGFLYALHIIMIKKYSEGIDGGAFTAFQFIGGSCVALLVALLSEDITLITQIQPSIFLQIFYLAFFATAVTMLCQTIGQKNTSECNASLILSLESVFGVIFSVLFYGEILTMKIIIGFLFIFIAIIISETKLSFIKPKRFVQMGIVVFIFIGAFQMNPVYANGLSVASPYAYVYDMTTDQVLYEKNANHKIYPASMTKVMTALVALDQLDEKKLSQVEVMKKYDFEGLWEAGASTANLEVGEKVTYLDLLYGIILPSGADACRATARLLFGSEEKMAEAMNAKAKELGLKNTHFVNTTGLHDDNHYTTVKDMGIITKTALQNPTFKTIFTSRSYRTSTTNHYMAASILKLYWRTHMGISHIIGCKTGYTDHSKSCLTSLVQSQKNDLICVFAKAKNSQEYVNDAKNIVNYYNKNYETVVPYKENDLVTKIQIEDGVQTSYDIVLPQDVQFYMSKGTNKKDFRIEYMGKTVVEAPTKKGEELGKLVVSFKDKEMKSMTVSMNQNIDATSWAKFSRFVQKNIVMISISIVTICGMIFGLFKYIKARRNKIIIE